MDLAQYEGALEEHGVRVGRSLGIAGAGSLGDLAEPVAVALLVPDRRAVNEVARIRELSRGEPTRSLLLGKERRRRDPSMDPRHAVQQAMRFSGLRCT